MIERLLQPRLLDLATRYPVLTLTGPRQSGKTTLSHMAFPDRPYVSLENPAQREFAEEDPVAFLARYRDGAIPEAHHDPELARDFHKLPQHVCALLDRAEATQALEQIWQRVRRLNRYVEERAPWQLAKDPARAGELDVTLASLAEGVRAISVLLHPYMPASTQKLLTALGSPATAFDHAAFSSHSTGATAVPLDPLFPKRA